MKVNHPRASQYIAEREKGLTYREIAEKYGVSKQTVAQACGRWTPGHFKPCTAEQVAYPNLRRWINKNRITRAEFIRRMGYTSSQGMSARVRGWFKGAHIPDKGNIDRILEVTGLTYEELFSPVETEPRGTARWEKKIEGCFYRYVCTHCGEPEQVKEVMGRPDWRYCPNCGWPMEVDG